jgi:protein-S-isoprenylcysteine O-methyltransferase Ste14
MSYTRFLIIFLLGSGIFRFFELFWLKRNKRDGSIRSGWTLPVLGAGYSLVLFCAMFELMMFPKRLNIFLSITGIIIMILRVPIKFWAASTLSKYWSPQVEIRNDHKLIIEGPYKILRHPAYFSAILELFGVPLAANSYYTLSSISVLMFVLFLIRIRIEEEALEEKFGESYLKYKKETFSLIPIKKTFFT